MAKFAVKYEIEVIVESEIENQAWEKAGKVFDAMDYSGFESVRYLRKVSSSKVNESGKVVK